MTTFWDATATVAAVNAATTLKQMRDATTTFGNVYDLQIDFPPSGQGAEYITFIGLNDSDVPSIKSLVASSIDQFARYPPVAIRASRLSSVSFIKTLSSPNGAAGVWINTTQTLYLCLFRGALGDLPPGPKLPSAIAYTTNHEFAHCIDSSSSFWNDQTKANFIQYNPHPYGVYEPYEATHYPGFISGYAEENIREDFAEIHAKLILPQERVTGKIIVAEDPVVAYKAGIVRQSFAAVHQDFMLTDAYVVESTPTPSAPTPSTPTPDSPDGTPPTAIYLPYDYIEKSGNEYIYRTVDLKTNEVLEDLDLTNVKFQRKLSAIGSLSADMYIPDDIRGRLLDLSTQEGRTGLYVLRNGVPVWGGIIWKRDWNEQSSTYTLSCGTWESYAYHVVQRYTYDFNQVDQFAIANTLLRDNQIAENSSISYPALKRSGFLRDRRMYDYERKTVGDELNQLASLENGFDYRVENLIDPSGNLGRRYLFGYPNFGAPFFNDGTDLTFTYPGNLQPYKHVSDAENSGWTVFSIGAGEGTEMNLAQASDFNYQRAGWPELHIVTSYKSVERYDTLQSHAAVDLRDNKPSQESFTFQLNGDSEIQLDSINEGDRARFIVSSRRWDQPKTFTARIGLIDVTPENDQKLETVALGLIDEEE